MAIQYSDFSKNGCLGLKTVAMTGAEGPFPPNATAGIEQVFPDDLEEVLIRAIGGTVTLTLKAGSSDTLPIEDGAALKIPAQDMPNRRIFLNGDAGVSASIFMYFDEVQS